MGFMKRLMLPILAAAALTTGAGCYTQGDVGVGYSYGYASAGYASPDLYYLGPGVSVVAYSDYPAFYADNYYWMYSGGLWYRSSYYGSGWVVYNDVPYSVRSIRNPYGYTRFQPGRGWTRVSANGSYGGSYNPRGYNARGAASSAPPAAYSAPRGGRPSGSTYRSNGGYSSPSHSNGGVTVTPRGGGGGPTVRDHRRR